MKIYLSLTDGRKMDTRMRRLYGLRVASAYDNNKSKIAYPSEPFFYMVESDGENPFITFKCEIFKT